jgi:hypothetical protein
VPRQWNLLAHYSLAHEGQPLVTESKAENGQAPGVSPHDTSTLGP